jgi:hypothetical protein
MAALALAVALPGVPRAHVFYSMPGARPVSDASPVLGMALGVGDNVTRLVGFGRFNAATTSDIGIELVFESYDTGRGSDDEHLYGAGIDFKHLVVKREENKPPVDIAVQFGGGFLAQSGYTLIKIPLGALVSRTFVPSEGHAIVPYAGVYLIMDFAETGSDYDSSWDSDLDVELRVGGSAQIAKQVSAFAALHTGNGTLFFLGFTAGL